MRRKLLLGALALGLLSLGADRVERKVFVSKDGHFGEGRLEATPEIRLLHLYGRPYELGYQHGALLRDDLEKAAASAPRPSPTFRIFSPGNVAIKPYRPELRGLAAGSGLSFNKLVALNVTAEISAPNRCAVTASAPAEGREGIIRLGCRLTNPDLAVMFFHPEGKLKFVAINPPGQVGTSNGMNEAGIAVAWERTASAEPTENRERPALFGLVLRRVLEAARTIDQATALVASSSPPAKGRLIIASRAEKRAVALEGIGKRNRVVELADPKSAAKEKADDILFDRSDLIYDLAKNELWVKVGLPGSEGRRWQRVSFIEETLGDELPESP